MQGHFCPIMLKRDKIPLSYYAQRGRKGVQWPLWGIDEKKKKRYYRIQGTSGTIIRLVKLAPWRKEDGY